MLEIAVAVLLIVAVSYYLIPLGLWWPQFTNPEHFNNIHNEELLTDAWWRGVTGQGPLLMEYRS